nr:MAG TPA: hypothetical protein [Caudoviricetes sp.]
MPQTIPFCLLPKPPVAAYPKSTVLRRQIWKPLKPLSMRCMPSTMFQSLKFERSTFMTHEEKFMLHMLKIGEYDGAVGKLFYDQRGYIVGYWIMNGIPGRYEAKPFQTTYHGKRNEITYHKPYPVNEYTTDDEKLLFLKQYGHYLRDSMVQEYSNTSGVAVHLPKSFPKPTSLPEEPPPPKTETEIHLLERLANGELDGSVGLPCDNGWGSMIWYWIEDGVIKRFKQGPTKRFFNGDENEKIIPDWKPDLTLKTEAEQLNFLRRSGRHMKDPEVIAYSDNYWADYWSNKNRTQG